MFFFSGCSRHAIVWLAMYRYMKLLIGFTFLAALFKICHFFCMDNHPTAHIALKLYHIVHVHLFLSFWSARPATSYSDTRSATSTCTASPTQTDSRTLTRSHTRTGSPTPTKTPTRSASETRTSTATTTATPALGPPCWEYNKIPPLVYQSAKDCSRPWGGVFICPQRLI